MLADILTRIEQRLRETGLSASKASTLAGLSADGIRNLQRAVRENKHRAGISTKTLTALAGILETTPEYLLSGTGPTSTSPASIASPRSRGGKVVDLAGLRASIRDLEARSPPPSKPSSSLRPIGREIPVLGEVAAGVWREAVARDTWQETEETIPVDVTGYERATLFAMRVVGPSMNEVFKPGRYVIVAPVAEAGIRDGDYVVVERARIDLVEITLKQLVVEDAGRVALWPRSSDPAFQQPFYLRGSDADQSKPRIIGVVIGDYAKTERPSANALFELPETYAE